MSIGTTQQQDTRAPGEHRERKGDVTSSRPAAYTAPSLDLEQGHHVADLLQQRLVSLIDLTLTLKHIHWNVVGPNFIAVHQMLDPQYEGVSQMVDDVAERIATLGGVPSGLISRIAACRDWDDYDLDRADSIAHLGALDLVYQGVIGEHRATIDSVREIDNISEDLLIGQTARLERYHWFVRSHLADWAGGLANAGTDREVDAARAVAVKSSPARQRSDASAAAKDGPHTQS